MKQGALRLLKVSTFDTNQQTQTVWELLWNVRASLLYCNSNCDRTKCASKLFCRTASPAGRPTCSYRMQFGQYASTDGTFRPRSSKSLNGRADFTVTSVIISQFQCMYIALLFPKCFLLCSGRISYPFVLMIRLPVIHSRYTNIEGPHEQHRWTDITH
jgi:hypothetical protein